jgi:hypothetical protein
MRRFLVSPICTVLFVFGSILLAGIAFWLTPSQVLTTPRVITPQELPAFYTGGLEQGSGGKLEQNWDAYDSKNLFTPSQARNTQNALMPQSAYATPEACGSCHVSIHKNWQQSIHASSATDNLYLKVKDLFVFERGEPAVRLCAGCHAPVALMTGEVGLYNKESASSKAGVSCGFCHSVEMVHGGNGAYVSQPARVRSYWGGDYLKNPRLGLSFGDGVSRFLVNTKPQAHAEDMRPPALLSGQVCQSCHEFKINGVNVQSTWSEWQASSYPSQGKTCTSCHFRVGIDDTALEPAEIVPGRLRQHLLGHFLSGGSTLISPRASENVDYLRAALGLSGLLKSNQLIVNVANLKAGHSIPTGVSDLRQLWLEVKAFSSSDVVVFSSGTTDLAGELQKDSVIFHQVLADERGFELKRHDIWSATKILEDTRIPASGSRKAVFALPSSTVRVSVRLLWRDVPAGFAQIVLSQSGASIPVQVLHEWTGRR